MPYNRLFSTDLGPGAAGLTTVGYYLGAAGFSQANVYERMRDGSFRAVGTAPGSVAGTGKYQAVVGVPSGTINTILWVSDSSVNYLYDAMDDINPGGPTEYLDGKVSLVATQTSVNAIPTNPALASDVNAARDAVNTGVQAIKAKTDLVQFDANGFVKSVAQNLPNDYQQRGVAVTLPMASPATWRAVLAATQPDFSPAKPSDVSPTIAFSPTISPTPVTVNPTPVTVNPTLTTGQATTLSNLDSLMESSGVGGHERFKATALEQAPAAGGGSGSGLTPDEHNRLFALGGAMSSATTLPAIDASGRFAVKQGYSYTAFLGRAYVVYSSTWPDLTNAVVQLRVPDLGLTIVGTRTVAGLVQTVSFNLPSATTANMRLGNHGFTVAALFNTESIDLSSGVVQVQAA